MKKITILGGGESGVGAAILAKVKGLKVFLSDIGVIQQKYKKILLHEGIDFEENKHTQEKIFEADEVIKSPGISEDLSIIQKLREEGIPVISEIEFASRYTKAVIIAITGTNGKTTTSSLLYYLLKSTGLKAGLAGNIGKSFAGQVAKQNFDFYVLELSSFQLDGIVNFKPHISILLNITPDHLDRYHHKMENYVQSKFRIAMNQTPDDFFIYSADDEEIKKVFDKQKIKAKKIPFSLVKKLNQGAFINNLKLIIKNEDTKENFTMGIDELALQGKHNTANSMAAGIAARLLNVRKKSLKKSLSTFEAVEHRLEKVLTIHGIDFINDSKATNVNSSYYALESINTPVIWIVGGKDKGNDYKEVLNLVKTKVKAMVCLGENNATLLSIFDDVAPYIIETHNMRDAVQFSYALGEKGDTVLLSPACASFDLFKNYEDRGNQFKEQVRKL